MNDYAENCYRMIDEIQQVIENCSVETREEHKSYMRRFGQPIRSANEKVHWMGRGSSGYSPQDREDTRNAIEALQQAINAFDTAYPHLFVEQSEDSSPRSYHSNSEQGSVIEGFLKNIM